MHHSLAVEHDDDEKEDPVVDDGPPASSWTKFSSLSCLAPVDLYLIAEKSIRKNQVQQTAFLVYFKLDLYCLCSLQKSSSMNLIFQT